MDISYEEHLVRKAKQQLEEQGRIDMCLASEMMTAGMEVAAVERQLLIEIENEQ